jgi:hypothetical protein
MSNGQVADDRLRRFGVTRSLQDRAFLFLLGAVQVSCAVCFLEPCLKRLGNHGDADMLLAFGVALWIEFLFALLVLGGCCLIWEIVAPDWLERFFSRTLAHLWVVLSLAGLFLLIAARYAFTVLA